MSISKLGVTTGSDNWELISSVTPAGSVTAVNFTGLSVYKKLALRWSNVELNSATYFRVRLNNDSASNYDTSYAFEDTQMRLRVNMAETDFRPMSSDSIIQSGFLEIVNCDTTGLKYIVDGYVLNATTNTYKANNHYGIYRASAVISQVNLIFGTITTGAGTVALYGAK